MKQCFPLSSLFSYHYNIFLIINFIKLLQFHFLVFNFFERQNIVSPNRYLFFFSVTGTGSMQTNKKRKRVEPNISPPEKRLVPPSPELSSSEDSSSESETESSTLLVNTAEVVSHETIWNFGTNVTIDSFKDSKFLPRLHVQDTNTMCELDYWLLFFPFDDINHILACTNAHLRDKRKEISKHEFFKVIGLLYAMSLNILHVRRDYWSQTDGLFPAPAFGERFGIGLHRFEEILSCMSFTMPCEKENGDPWYQVRPLVDMTVKQWRLIISPGYKLTIDESMFAWYGKDNYDPDGMPAVMKIKRKPKGVGCEVKTICDSASRIMVGMEINEGKDVMCNKKWQRELGAGTATTLRLTEPWHGTGRIVVGDSWFGSVKTSTELRKRGLYFLGMVKTAHKNYPLKEAVRRCPQGKGSAVVATARREETDLIAVAWRDLKVHTFVGTCSTTIPGQPCRKKRTNENGQVIFKEVSRPKLVEEYFSGAPAIDIHNHIRQDGLSLETVWSTQKWQHRMFACIFGIIETNAFLAYNFFINKRNSFEQSVSHAQFTENVALQLIKNKYGLGIGNSTSEESESQQETSNGVTCHMLQPLAKDDEKRNRVQRKCLICSRVRRKQVKASYYCKKCGPKAVICSPQTGRDCFEYHLLHGIPLRS